MIVENEGNNDKNITKIITFYNIKTLVYNINVKQHHILLCLLHKNNYYNLRLLAFKIVKFKRTNIVDDISKYRGYE